MTKNPSKNHSKNHSSNPLSELPSGPSVAELTELAAHAARTGGEVVRRWFGRSTLQVSLKGENDLVSQADHESEEAIIGVVSEAFPDHRILAEEGGLGSAVRGDQSSAFEWIIDPLDGTSNFVHGLPIFCVSVACAFQDRVIAGAVYQPIADDLFLAGAGAGATRNGAPISVRQREGSTGDPADPLQTAFLSTGFPFRAHAVLDSYLEIFRWVFPRARGVRRCGAAALDLAHTAAGIYDGFFEFGLSPWDVAAGSLLVQEAGGRVSDFVGSDGFLRSGDIVAGSFPVWQALLVGIQERLSHEAIGPLPVPDRDHPGNPL